MNRKEQKLNFGCLESFSFKGCFICSFFEGTLELGVLLPYLPNNVLSFFTDIRNRFLKYLTIARASQLFCINYRNINTLMFQSYY